MRYGNSAIPSSRHSDTAEPSSPTTRLGEQKPQGTEFGCGNSEEMLSRTAMPAKARSTYTPAADVFLRAKDTFERGEPCRIEK